MNHKKIKIKYDIKKDEDAADILYDGVERQVEIIEDAWGDDPDYKKTLEECEKIGLLLYQVYLHGATITVEGKFDKDFIDVAIKND